MHKARDGELEDRTFVTEVPGLQGVPANAPTLEACRDELAEVIEGWVLIRVSKGLPVPAIDGITVAVSSGG